MENKNKTPKTKKLNEIDATLGEMKRLHALLLKFPWTEDTPATTATTTNVTASQKHTSVVHDFIILLELLSLRLFML